MKIKALCLDANIFLASFLPIEEHHETSIEIISMISRGSFPLYEPSVLLNEIASILHKKKFLQIIDQEDRDERMNSLEQFPIILLWQTKYMQLAYEYADRLSRKRIHDCLYLAVASEKKIPLISTDQSFIESARSLYGEVYSPADYLQHLQA